MHSRSAAGARNMLVNCAEATAGETVLIVHEPEGQGYYDDALPGVVAQAAETLGATAELLELRFDPRPKALPEVLQAAMDRADRTIFLARIGDQLRFGGISSGSAVVSYALDTDALGSAFGTADHRAFLALKDAVNTLFFGAREIRVTCPAGTDFSGAADSDQPAQEVGIRRFPMPVATPLPTTGFSGTVALPGFLAGTGSTYYEPYAVRYEGELSARFEGSQLTGFSGDAEAVRVAEAHYDHVARTLGIDRDFVHSWHVGIHPGCAFTRPAAEDYARWSGAAFGNPRLLHFHTCGAYAPGEISWNVVDPTITVDGHVVWDRGVLDPDAVPGAAGVLARFPEARAVFDRPERQIGL